MKQPMSKEGFRARFDEISAEHEALKQKYAGYPEKLAEVNEEMMVKALHIWGEWERFKSIDMIQEAKNSILIFPPSKRRKLGLDSTYPTASPF